MAVFVWFMALALAFAGLMFTNARARKQVFIFTTYVSLTGWYYYRKWEKSHGGGETPRSKPRSSKRSQQEAESDVVYFEAADKVRKTSEVDEPLSRRSQSETSNRFSETSSSGQSEDPPGKRRSSKGLGLFRKLRKSHRDEESESSSRVSDVSSVSGASVATGITTRRTFSGRKKPATWGE